jgi:ketosteroid isomerase-like protein
MVRGRAAIQRTLDAFRARGLSRLELTTVGLEVLGDGAFEIGRARITFSIDGKEKHDPGKYVSMWKRTAEGWRRCAYIFNSDTPAS